MRKLKIAVLASNLLPIPPKEKEIPPQWSGAPEKMISLLTEGLVKRGHKVTIFAAGNSKTKAKLVSVVNKNTFSDRKLKKFGERFWVHSGFYDLLLTSKLYQMAKNFDLIHYHFYNFLGGIFFAPFVQTPTLCTLHDLLSGTRKKILEEFKNSLYFVSISNSQRKTCPHLNYIKTIYHGIEIEKIPFSKNSEDYLVFFGRIHPDKGTKEAIKIAQLAKKKIFILGSHGEDEYWQKEIVPKIDNKNVIYKGFLSQAKVFQIVKKALAFLFPLQWEEPFGLSVIEAMACGTPVVAFNRGSIPEIIKDKETGFIVNSIEEAVESIKKINKIKREKCRQWVEKNFNLQRMIKEYEEVFFQILKKT